MESCLPADIRALTAAQTTWIEECAKQLKRRTPLEHVQAIQTAYDLT